MKRGIFLIVGLSVATLLSGCNKTKPSLSETEEPLFIKGQQCLREKRESDALRCFLALTDRRPDAALAHLETGRLFLQVENDPVECIHYLRRYMALRPNSKHAALISQLIETAKKEFLKQIPTGTTLVEADPGSDFSDLVRQLKEENQQLRQQLQSKLALTTSAPGTGAPAAAQATPYKPAKTKTYTIVSGDTLSKISQKVYGVPHRWKEIFEANKNTLHAPHNLRVGMELRIP